MSESVLVTVLISIKIGILATVFNIPIAVIISYFMGRYNFKGKQIIDGIINLPLVLPPVTTGYILILIFGKYGIIGSLLFNLTGIRIAFTQTAAVISSMVVSFPLIVRSIRISIEMIDQKLEVASMTLGANKIETFIRITTPLILPGLISGFILGFARSMGEFGATITFAGNIEGETRTIPLSVYSLLQVPGRENSAALLVVISVLISFLAMFGSSVINKKLSSWRVKQ